MKKTPLVVMIRAALLGAIGTVLMQLSFRLPIFPVFLALDVSDLPALVGAITTGPLTGLLATLIKNLLDPLIFGMNTGGIGNLANFTMGVALVVPIGLIFQKRKDSIGFITGGAAGIVTLVIVASLMNYFVLLPVFGRLIMPMERIIEIANAVNGNVTDVPSLILFAIVPFNLLKGTITAALGFLLYRVMPKKPPFML